MPKDGGRFKNAKEARNEITAKLNKASGSGCVRSVKEVQRKKWANMKYLVLKKAAMAKQDPKAAPILTEIDKKIIALFNGDNSQTTHDGIGPQVQISPPPHRKQFHPVTSGQQREEPTSTSTELNSAAQNLMGVHGNIPQVRLAHQQPVLHVNSSTTTTISIETSIHMMALEYAHLKLALAKQEFALKKIKLELELEKERMTLTNECRNIA